MPLRLAVLVSGTGSLLAAMIEQKLPIGLVIADRQCTALTIAAKAGINYVLVSRTFSKTFDRDAFTRKILLLLREHHIDFVAMAGFMTVFAPLLFTEDAYRFKILNTHPSLLPSFKGAHAVKDALEYGVKITGCTIHWATDELDAGPTIAQKTVPVLQGDTVESLHERIKAAERELYPTILRMLLE